MLNTMIRLPKNVWIIAATLSLAISGIPLLVLVSGLIGSRLAPMEELATLPLALNVVGLAIFAIPAAVLARKFGRKKAGFVGLCSAFTGMLLCAASTLLESFNFLLLGALFIGFSTAFFQQFRFAAIESLKDLEDTGPALSVIMLCSIVAGILGPEIGDMGRDLINSKTGYTASFLLMALIILLAMSVWTFFQNPHITEDSDSGPGRHLSDIVRQPLFLIALTASLIGYAVMSFLMTSTPISMHLIQGHSLDESKWVIQSHLIAMFAPSLFSGLLIKRFGPAPIMLVGSLLYLLVVAIASAGHHLLHYWWALVLLGIGWNFLFISGTSLLPQTYQHSERFKAQAVNDFSIFLAQALASLSAGWILYRLGWMNQVLICLPFVVFMLIVALVYLLVFRKKS